MVLLSPPLSVKVATPFAKVTPLYSPLIVVSVSVTVKLNSFVLSVSFPARVLLTVRLPSASLVFVKAALCVSSPTIVPVSPVFVVT